MSFEIVDIDNGFDDFFAMTEEIVKKEVEVGYTQSSGDHGDMGLAELAVLMEFGGESEVSEEYRSRAEKKGVSLGDSINIPARPAMRNSFDNSEQEIGDFGVKLLDKYLDGKFDSELLYESWGDFYRNIFMGGVVSKSLGLVENAPFAVRIKGSDTPWIDSGRLINGSTINVQKK